MLKDLIILLLLLHIAIDQKWHKTIIQLFCKHKWTRRVRFDQTIDYNDGKPSEHVKLLRAVSCKKCGKMNVFKAK